MQDDKTPEYIVRDYTAVDKQIEEVARREKTLTDRMRLENLTKLAVIIGGLGLVAGLVFTNLLGNKNNESSRKN